MLRGGWGRGGPRRRLSAGRCGLASSPAETGEERVKKKKKGFVNAQGDASFPPPSFPPSLRRGVTRRRAGRHVPRPGEWRRGRVLTAAATPRSRLTSRLPPAVCHVSCRRFSGVVTAPGGTTAPLEQRTPAPGGGRPVPERVNGLKRCLEAKTGLKAGPGGAFSLLGGGKNTPQLGKDIKGLKAVIPLCNRRYS